MGLKLPAVFRDLLLFFPSPTALSKASLILETFSTPFLEPQTSFSGLSSGIDLFSRGLAFTIPRLDVRYFVEILRGGLSQQHVSNPLACFDAIKSLTQYYGSSSKLSGQTWR